MRVPCSPPSGPLRSGSLSGQHGSGLLGLYGQDGTWRRLLWECGGRARARAERLAKGDGGTRPVLLDPQPWNFSLGPSATAHASPTLREASARGHVRPPYHVRGHVDRPFVCLPGSQGWGCAICRLDTKAVQGSGQAGGWFGFRLIFWVTRAVLGP